MDDDARSDARSTIRPPRRRHRLRRARPRRARGRERSGPCSATYQSVTSEAHTPHAMTSQTTSPGPGLRHRHVLDPDLVRGDRPRDPHLRWSVASEASPTGVATPRSVTSAVTSAAGVTSNAGLRQRVAVPVSCRPRSRGPRRRRAPRSRSRRRSGVVVDRRGRPGDDERDPGGTHASASPYVPTLLATSPLAATRSQPRITASTAWRAIRPAAAESTTSWCGMFRAAPARQRSASRPAAAAETRWRGPPRGVPRSASSAITASAVPRPGRRARRCCSGS